GSSYIASASSPYNNSVQLPQFTTSSLEDRTSNSSSLRHWIDKNLDPELARMKHVSNMGHNTESDNHIILEKGVSLQIVLRPVQALIPRTPLADATRIVWIVCTVNLNQPRIVGGIELP